MWHACAVSVVGWLFLAGRRCYGGCLGLRGLKACWEGQTLCVGVELVEGWLGWLNRLDHHRAQPKENYYTNLSEMNRQKPTETDRTDSNC